MNPRRLPLAESRRVELETCGYCPKLCRSTCPVSNAEPRDTLIPWGKMTTAWLVARGVLPAEHAAALTAWACTECGACSQFCEHDNPVVPTLLEARAQYRRLSIAPAAAERVVAGHRARLRRVRSWLAARSGAVRADAPQGTALLIGCAYVTGAPAVAVDILDVAKRLLGPVEPLGECCGAPLRAAGDLDGYLAARQRLLEKLGSRRLVVADPGCAVALEPRPHTLLELLDAERRRLSPLRDAPRPARYHDPCHLARDLRLVDAPRRILERVLGEAPGEFLSRTLEARCSGAGGLLPLVMPRISRRIAGARLDEHRRLGGGTLITACGASLRRFQSLGTPVLDVMSLVRRSLELG